MDAIRESMSTLAELVTCRKDEAVKEMKFLSKLVKFYWRSLTPLEQDEIDNCYSAMQQLIDDFFPELRDKAEKFHSH